MPATCKKVSRKLALCATQKKYLNNFKNNYDILFTINGPRTSADKKMNAIHAVLNV